jgi:protein-S-isoprenylcysteine O-methyltransferase Ste14
VLQVLLIVLVIVAGLLAPTWPRGWRIWPQIAAAPLSLVGALLFVGGGLGLGRQLTPFPKPIAGGSLRQDGVYGLVRHPMYGGVLLIASAWSLVSSPLALAPTLLGAVLVDAKARREEAWLLEEHPDYVEYQGRVHRRFIPFVW